MPIYIYSTERGVYMKITVLGATGATGQQVVKMLLEQDHTVIAYVRNPSKIEFTSENLTVIKGDIFDRPLMASSIAGSDALISCLGSSTTKKSDELALMAASVVKVMEDTKVPKAVYMATAGIDNEFKGVMKWFIQMILGNVIADHRVAAKQYTKKSGLNYVIARPLQLKDGKASFKYSMAEEGLPKSKRPISRANVADFLIQAATTDQFDYKSIALAE